MRAQLFMFRPVGCALAAQRIAASLVTMLAVAGCVVGPNYHAPEVRLDSAYSAVQTPRPKRDTGRIVPALEAPERWWAVFEDPELNSLVDRALRGNRDLKVALARLREARAQRAMVAAHFWPSVDVAGGYNRGHGSRNVQLPFGGGSGGSKPTSAESSLPAGTTMHAEQGPPADVTFSSDAVRPGAPTSPFGEGGLPGVTTNLYQVGFDATWELDFFGASRRALESANATVEAVEEGSHAVTTSLLAEVAGTYIQLRAVQSRRAVALATIESQKDLVAIAKARLEAGAGSQLELARQAAELGSLEAKLPTLDALERKAAHTLAFLVGAPPDALVAELTRPGPLPEIPPRVPIGVPSDLLRRRPDIRQAERSLAAATAQVGVATAELFPRFSLTGAIGLDSSDVRHLPEPSSHYYSIAPGIRWPVLDWGRARAAVRVQNAAQEQALIQYESAVAEALRDVEDALVQFQREQDRRTALARAFDSSREAWSLARQAYEQGVVDETDALDARRGALQAEDSLVQSDAALRTDLVALYKALGGGWSL